LDKDKPQSLTAAIKDFFGFKPDQSLQQFMMELKELSDQDKTELKAGLIQNGYKIKD
jgi:hypothetical protein